MGERELLAGATTEVTRIGPALNKSDGVTPSTALTISASDLRLSKNGGAFTGATSSVVASTEYGYYSVAWGSTDIDTPGDLTVAVNMPSTILPMRHVYKIRAANVYGALHLQTTYLQTDAQLVAGVTPLTESGLAAAVWSTASGGQGTTSVADAVWANSGVVGTTWTTTEIANAVWSTLSGGQGSTSVADAVWANSNALQQGSTEGSNEIVTAWLNNASTFMAGAVWNPTYGGKSTTQVADGVWANSAVPANFSTLAINTSGEVTLGTDNSINGYWAKVRRNPAGEFTARWYYRDQPLDTGCTSPTISLINRDFTTLLGSTPMSQDGVTGRVTYDTTLSSTSALFIRLSITHGGAARPWEEPYLRDT